METPTVPPPAKIILNHHKVTVTGYPKNEDQSPVTQELTIKLPSDIKIAVAESSIVLQTWDTVSKFGGITTKEEGRYLFYPLAGFKNLECEVSHTVAGTSVVQTGPGGANEPKTETTDTSSR